MHGRDSHGAVASMASVAKLPFEGCAGWYFQYLYHHPGALGKRMRFFAGDIEIDLNLNE